MHINAEDVIVQCVDAAGRLVSEGESGEIVVTHLATQDFPFIRYRTGDVGVLDSAPCACGRGLPKLKEVHGRTSDFVVARDGTPVHGLALIYVIRDIPGIRAFKIIQESLDQTCVLLQPGTGFDPKCIPVIRMGMRARLGMDVSIDIKQVQEIKPEASGKFRYVVSKVPMGSLVAN
jgi:phenylacetate-CoA ligase